MGSPQRFATPEGRLALGRFFLLKGPIRRRCWTSSTTSPSSSSPTSSKPTWPPPSWPWTSRTSPWPRRPSARPPKSAAEDPRFHYLLARAYSAEDRRGGREGAGRGPQDQPAPRRQPAPAGRPPDRFREVRRSRRGPQAGLGREPARAEGLGLPGRAGPPPERPRRRKPPRAHSALDRWTTNPEVDHLIGRKLSQKYRFAEGSALSATRPRGRPRLSARQDPALPGPAPTGPGGRGLEAGRRDLRQRCLQRRRLQPDDAARPPRRLQDAARAMDSSCGWSLARPNSTAGGSWTCCGVRRRRSARSTA